MGRNDPRPALSCSIEEISEEEFLRSRAGAAACYEAYYDDDGKLQLRKLPPIARA